VEVVQLENVTHPEALLPYRVLLLTYEGQKPLRPQYHEALAAWVKRGNGLIFCEAGTDPYHQVREWWNEDGARAESAYEHLFCLLEVPFAPTAAPAAVGEGFVHVLAENPSTLQQTAAGGETVRAAVQAVLKVLNIPWQAQHYLRVDRGPYAIVSVLEESVSSEPFLLEGRYVDLLAPRLGVFSRKALAPGERGLYYNLDWQCGARPEARVVAAAGRVREEVAGERQVRFIIRGPAKTTAAVRLQLPRAAQEVRLQPARDFEQRWDEASRTLLLVFEHALDTRVEVAF